MNNMNENFNESFFAAMGSFMRNFNYDNSRPLFIYIFIEIIFHSSSQS